MQHVIYLVSTDNVTFTPVTINGNTTYTVAPGTHIYVKATVDDPTKYQIGRVRVGPPLHRPR